MGSQYTSPALETKTATEDTHLLKKQEFKTPAAFLKPGLFYFFFSPPNACLQESFKEIGRKRDKEGSDSRIESYSNSF